jgi:hypothetical protein
VWCQPRLHSKTLPQNKTKKPRTKASNKKMSFRPQKWREQIIPQWLGEEIVGQLSPTPTMVSDVLTSWVSWFLHTGRSFSHNVCVDLICTFGSCGTISKFKSPPCCLADCPMWQDQHLAYLLLPSFFCLCCSLSSHWSFQNCYHSKIV